MPPTNPANEQIAAQLRTNVAAITAGATYFNTYSTVLRPKSFGSDITPADKLVIMTEEEPVRFEEFDAMANPRRIGWRMTIVFSVFLFIADDASEPLQELINQVIHDIQKGVMADPQISDGASNLALDTMPLDPVSVRPEEAQGYEGVIVPFVVTYRVREDDPSAIVNA